jgi:hypothetical protein
MLDPILLLYRILLPLNAIPNKIPPMIGCRNSQSRKESRKDASGYLLLLASGHDRRPRQLGRP